MMMTMMMMMLMMMITAGTSMIRPGLTGHQSRCDCIRGLSFCEKTERMEPFHSDQTTNDQTINLFGPKRWEWTRRRMPRSWTRQPLRERRQEGSLTRDEETAWRNPGQPCRHFTCLKLPQLSNVATLCWMKMKSPMRCVTR